jgi:hypothetical protein
MLAMAETFALTSLGNEMRRGIDAVEQNGRFAVAHAANEFGKMEQLLNPPDVQGGTPFWSASHVTARYMAPVLT